MTRRWAPCAIALAVVACAAPVQRGVFLQGVFDIPDELMTREVPANEMRYLIRFPDAAAPPAGHRLVVFLHGSGDDDYDSRWLTSYGLPAVALFGELPTDERFVLLAPQAAPGTSWGMGEQAATVVALIDSVVTEHGLDPASVSLTGLSMGGYGTWHVATRFPTRFARVASVSGSGYGTIDLPDGLDVCALAQVDLRAYHGADDMISLPDANAAVVAQWEERCGAAIDFRLLPGRGHFSTFDTVYRDPAFYDWFLTG